MNSLVADLIVILHFGFILFVLFGGLLNYLWKHAWYVHVPALIWGVVIELTGWICPLTPLENQLRAKANDATYTSGFIEHYLMPILYPPELTRDMQIAFAAVVVIINLIIYIHLYNKKSLNKRRSS